MSHDPVIPASYPFFLKNKYSLLLLFFFCMIIQINRTYIILWHTNIKLEVFQIMTFTYKKTMNALSNNYLKEFCGNEQMCLLFIWCQFICGLFNNGCVHFHLEHPPYPEESIWRFHHLTSSFHGTYRSPANHVIFKQGIESEITDFAPEHFFIVDFQNTEIPFLHPD